MNIDKAWELGPEQYIRHITDCYLEHIGGEINAESINKLSVEQHTLLAYRYILDEVMEGGFIQLIQNGYGPYVLSGPFPMMVKKHWELKEFGKYLFDVRHEYHLHKEELEADLNEEEFMALYEQQETMNELGDDFLDIYQEEVTPAIATFVREHQNLYLL